MAWNWASLLSGGRASQPRFGLERKIRQYYFLMECMGYPSPVFCLFLQKKREHDWFWLGVASGYLAFVPGSGSLFLFFGCDDLVHIAATLDINTRRVLL